MWGKNINILLIKIVGPAPFIYLIALFFTDWMVPSSPHMPFWESFPWLMVYRSESLINYFLLIPWYQYHNTITIEILYTLPSVQK